MSFFKDMHFKNKIFLCMLFTSCTTVTILLILFYAIFYQDNKNKILTTYQLNIEQASEELSYIFSEMRTIANDLSADTTMQDNLIIYHDTKDEFQQLSFRQTIENRFPQRINNYAIGFETILCTVYGDIFYSGAQQYFEEYNGSELLKEDWFWENDYTVHNLGWWDSSSMFDGSTKDSNFYITRSITDQNTGEKLGAFRLGFSDNYIRHQISNLIGTSHTSYIVNDTGYVLSSNDPSQIATTLKFTIPQSITQWNDSYLISSPIAYTPWSIVVSVPSNSLNLNMDQILIVIFFVMLLEIILSSMLAYFLSNSITHPVNTLIEQVKQIDVKDFKPIPHSEISQDEIGLLATTIQNMTSHLNLMMERLIQKERERSEAEVKFLRTQINPHFLHNTLKSIPYLVEHGRAEENNSIIVALTSILKESMASTAAMIPLAKELDLLRSYLVIMQIRYNYMFDFSIEYDSEFSDILIPRLSLQPLLENAVFHGASMDQDSFLYIKLQVTYESSDSSKAHIKIIDNGCGMTADRLAYINQIASGQGISTERVDSVAIPNITKRLNYYYENPILSFESEVGKGTCVHLIVPILREETDEGSFS